MKSERTRDAEFPQNVLFSFSKVKLFRITAYRLNLTTMDSLFLIGLVHWENGNMDFHDYVSEKNGAGCQDLGLRQIFKVIL